MTNKPSRGASGKPIERIIISCVTYDTVKITDPIEYYDATRAYLLRYSKEDGDYEKVFLRVKNILEERFDSTLMTFNTKEGRCEDIIYEKENVSSDGGGVEDSSGNVDVNKIIKELTIVDVNEPVYDFQTMLRTVFSIMECERKDSESLKNPIYVNISAGTSEFSAAALIASMMFENVEVFSVPTDEFMIKDDSLYHDDNDNFVGLAKSVETPRPIESFSISRPDKRLVLSLRVYHDEGYPTSTKTIEALRNFTCTVNDKKFNLWDWDETEQSEIRDTLEKSVTPNDKMKFQRQFIDKWMAENLIIRIGRGAYKLSSHG